MTLAAATLLAGIACAAVGGEFFLRGIVAIGRRVRLSGAAIGATLAAFATSSPEFFVGVSSAFAGRPQLSLGDCLGSNVVNITIVLGGALLFGPLGYTKQARSWDLPVSQ
jgi:cation:H+ antiporter